MAETNRVLKFKNEFLSFISSVLGKLELDIQPSCARRRFLRLVKPLAEELEAEQNELRQKYADKLPSGEMKVSAGKLIFSAKNRKEFNLKWEALQEQEVLIDVTPAFDQDILTIEGLLEREIMKFEELKKGIFNAVDFDYVETLKEILEALKAVLKK